MLYKCAFLLTIQTHMPHIGLHVFAQVKSKAHDKTQKDTKGNAKNTFNSTRHVQYLLVSEMLDWDHQLLLAELEA